MQTFTLFLGFVVGVGLYLLLGIVRVARSPEFRWDIQRLKHQRRLKLAARRDLRLP